jgi:hypothetical protein
MVTRAREAIRLFFDPRTKKFQAVGCKAILTAEIHGTGSIGRRSLVPGKALPFSFWPDGCGLNEKGPGLGWPWAWYTSLPE